MNPRLNRLLFQQTDIKVLALFRMAIGLWFFVDYAGMILIGRVQEAYIDAQVHFPFIGFEWVKPLPGWAMYAVFGVMAIAALGILFGYRYRLAMLIFLIGQVYVFMIDIVYTLNKFYLFIILAVVLIFIPANRSWSLDVKWGRVKTLLTLPRWMLLIFQVSVGLIYFYSGLSKLNYDWLVLHQPLSNHLSWQWPFKVMGEDTRAMVIALMSYGGAFFDLTIAGWLSFRKTRWFGHAYQISFHLLNFVLLGVGSLSIFMIVLTLLLFPPQWLQRKIQLQSFEGMQQPSSSAKRWTISLLSVYLLLNLLIPHRHYLIDNDVNWTEKGHRFSWRLMTRTKLGSNSTFMITDNQTGEVWRINPRKYLTGRQYRKMSAETDLVIVFAHWLEAEWARKGHDDVKINGFINTQLNAHWKQLLIDPQLDLTQVKRTVWTDEVSTVLER